MEVKSTKKSSKFLLFFIPFAEALCLDNISAQEYSI